MLIRGDARRIPLADKSVQCCVTSPPYFGLRSYLEEDDPAKECEVGTEETPEEYISTMVHIFRDVRRILRDDGTVWLNLGDSYNSGSGGYDDKYNGAFVGRDDIKRKVLKGKGRSAPDLKPKDLIGIPWRVALALQNDGWYLRADIIWAKGNPMPESCTDRPTKSHEYIFLLSKSERYFYDAEAVKEKASVNKPWSQSTNGGKKYGRDQNGGLTQSADDESGRNLRSVWNCNLRPYKGAHFATYPPELISPCIKAGTSAKGRCPTCGAPWRRVVEKEATGRIRKRSGGGLGTAIRREPLGLNSVDGMFQEGVVYRTVGWQPSCACPAHEPVPCIIFDPFVGSGTSIQESQRLGRVCVGMELSEKSLKLARDRIERPHKPQSARDPGEFLPLFDANGDASL
jgi:DNA modification methylase